MVLLLHNHAALEERTVLYMNLVKTWQESLSLKSMYRETYCPSYALSDPVNTKISYAVIVWGFHNILILSQDKGISIFNTSVEKIFCEGFPKILDTKL